MVMVKWVRGSDGNQLKSDIRAVVSTGKQLSFTIANTLEMVEYDDEALTAQEKASMNSLMNVNRFDRA